jgi:hypothetical protein
MGFNSAFKGLNKRRTKNKRGKKGKGRNESDM